MLIEDRRWFQVVFQLKGSVVPAVMGRTLFCGLFGVLISVVFYFQPSVNISAALTLIPNIVLGLLLVFRTNTAYERFWEGRKCWGSLVNASRNLARQIWITVDEKNPGDRDGKTAALRLITAFSVATKLHLRQEAVNEELEPLTSPTQYRKLQHTSHPPLEIAFWIGDYLQQQYEHQRLNSYQLSDMHKLLDLLVDMLGGCERILRTPMPMAYAIHLKQLLLLYCLSLPFQMVSSVQWWTGPIVALISFALFGIEEIGIEIENPFGHDPNDLPLDTICAVIHHNIEDLITLVPHAAQSQMAEAAERSLAG